MTFEGSLSICGLQILKLADVIPYTFLELRLVPNFAIGGTSETECVTTRGSRFGGKFRIRTMNGTVVKFIILPKCHRNVS